MGKILKHDFKNSYKEFLIMCATIIVMSILLGISCLFDLNSFFRKSLFFKFHDFLYTNYYSSCNPLDCLYY